MRTAKIDVDRIAIVFDKFGCGEEDVGVVGAELDCQRSVFCARLEHHPAVFDVSGEKSGVEHWRVAQLGAISACQHPVGQFRLVHHGSYKVLWPPNAVIKFVRVVFCLLAGNLCSVCVYNRGCQEGHFLVCVSGGDCFDHA